MTMRKRIEKRGFKAVCKLFKVTRQAKISDNNCAGPTRATSPCNVRGPARMEEKQAELKAGTKYNGLEHVDESTNTDPGLRDYLTSSESSRLHKFDQKRAQKGK